MPVPTTAMSHPNGVGVRVAREKVERLLLMGFNKPSASVAATAKKATAKKAVARKPGK